MDELIVAEERGLVAADLEDGMRARERSRSMALAVHEVTKRFKNGVHYMYVDRGRPTTKANGKPSLLLPGAECICALMGLRPDFITVASSVDGDPSTWYFHQECVLVAYVTGMEVSRGVGFYGAEDLVSTAKYQEPPNRNKMLKMANKRAYVDAAKRIAMLSGDFTQDMEPAEVEARQTAAANLDAAL